MTKLEQQAVDKLIAEHERAAISLTRRDPREKGPLLVHVDESTYEIDKQGHRKKVR